MENIKLSINTEKQQDYKFKGFGTSLSWFANAISNEESAEKLCYILFDKTNKDGLHLNIVRYNIGASMEKETLRHGGDIERYPETEKWDGSVDANQRNFLKISKKMGVQHFEAFANSPPQNMTRSGSVQGAKPWFKNIGFSNNLKLSEIDNFTGYLAKVTKFLIENDDIPFTSISPINEPSSPGWTEGCGQEACFYGFMGIRGRVINSLRKKLLAEGLFNVGITGCEENNMLQAFFGLVCNPFSWKNIDKYNVHRYRFGNALGFKTGNIEDSNIFRKMNKFLAGKKELWMSEVGFGWHDGITHYSDIRNALNFAISVIDDLNYLKPSAWVYWQVIENMSGNGWGCMQVDYSNPETIIYGAQFAAFQHFTHFIKPGMSILNVKQCSNKKIKWVCAFDTESKDTSIIIVSTDTKDSIITLSDIGSDKDTFLQDNVVTVMQSTGDATSTFVEKYSNIRNENTIIIKSNSVLSILITL
jgi:hypothetical protein